MADADRSARDGARSSGALSLSLQTDGFDQRRPLGFLAIDLGRIFFRRRRQRFHAFAGKALFDVLGGESRTHFLIEPLDNGTRRAGRRDRP